MRILRAAITTEELRKTKCSLCGGAEERCDDEIAIHSQCHPSAGTRAVYVKSVHALIISCRKCHALVLTIKFPDLP